VDDRLIHGQVTAGWIRPLAIERVVLANDLVANDEWEREIYTLAVPPEIEVKIETIEKTIEFLKNSPDNKKTIVLVNSLQDALRIIEGGVTVEKLNIGGLHYQEGKRAFANYIFLSEEDIQHAKKLIALGIKLEGREIPGAPTINLNEIIEKTDISQNVIN
ncbi:MAG: PTS sugar transporter subunit IIB, partial [candidate division WOR-3 bacterium]|nr:PTS sugar transporter subunit IIB [candidate division WOR-3 bacterium]